MILECDKCGRDYTVEDDTGLCNYCKSDEQFWANAEKDED